MRLLIIGGTVFLGRHLVSSAIAAGHQVTTLNRGTHDLAEQAKIERLWSDREVDLSVLSGRTFDAVIDTCAFYPDTIRRSVHALANSVGTYIFISTISVFRDLSAIAISENDPIQYTEPGMQGNYGTFKADCEKVLTDFIPERCLIVRPGLLAGPYDPTDRITYWPSRFARGGKVAVPEHLDRPVQFIDARDVASWVIRLAEEQARGIYIATGPEERLTLGGFFEACQDVARTESQIVRVEDTMLEKAGVTPWTELPLWIPTSMRSFAGAMRLDRRKAVEAGLKCRAVKDTLADTLAWDQKRDPSIPRNAGLSEELEAKLLKNPKFIPTPGKGPLPGPGLT